MNANDEKIIREVKQTVDAITHYSEIADLDSFLSYYANHPDFLAFAGDGRMNDFSGFKKIASEYYEALAKQKITTINEKFHVIDDNLVIWGWVGNIEADFKNGDKMIMNNYAVTCVFRKLDGEWKVIHSHESSLPPEIIKAK